MAKAPSNTASDKITLNPKAFELPGYRPDSWVILKVSSKDKAPLYRVLAGWKGGYLDGDSWRINSGIKSYRDADTHWVFEGFSGSAYSCPKVREGFSFLTDAVFSNLVKQSQAAGDVVVELLSMEQFKAQFSA